MHLQCQKILQPTLSRLNILMHRNIKVEVLKKKTQRKKKKKKTKKTVEVSIKIYIRWNDERDKIITNKIALNAVTGASRKIIIEQNCNGARVSVIRINFHIRLPLIDCSVWNSIALEITIARLQLDWVTEQRVESKISFALLTPFKRINDLSNLKSL